MRTLSLVLGAAVFVAATASAARAQNDTLVVDEAATPCLVIRASPHAMAAKQGCLPPGTKVVPIASAPYWRQVVLANGSKAWAAKKFLAAVAGSSLSGSDPDTTKWLEVHFVDVGQGDGILIRTPDDGIAGNGKYDGLTITIDGGPDRSDAKNEMFKYMSNLLPANTPIDAMIVSHPHDDHYPGAWGLLGHYQVRDFYDSGFPKTGTRWASFMQAVRNTAAPDGHSTTLHIGRDHFGAPSWGSELGAEFLYAYPGNPAGLGDANTVENNASIVLKLTYGQHSFLFMGDAEGKDRHDSPETPQFAEAILLQHPERLKATVLKIAHHGSETSSSTAFINAVDPDYVVVMSGRKKYGPVFLPDASTLKRYCTHKSSTRILRTDQDDESEGRSITDDADGDHVIIRTNGVRMVIEAFSNGQRITVDGCGG